MEHNFNINIRVLSCERCGAPVEAPEAGGTTSCGYCGTQMLVGRRQLESARTAHGLTGDARIAKLRLQTGRDLADNPYSTVGPPPGCEALIRSGLEPVQVQLAQRFREAMALVRADPSFEHQRLMWWCATMLNQGYGIVGKHLERRAVLERAVEELADPGFRHMLYVNLAGAAARFDEREAARAWIDKCDPEPDDLLLDSGYRVGLASVLVREGEAARTLELVGARVGDVPEAHQYRLMFAMYRIHGHEQLGHADHAIGAAKTIMADAELGGVLIEALGLNQLGPETVAALTAGAGASAGAGGSPGPAASPPRTLERRAAASPDIVSSPSAVRAAPPLQPMPAPAPAPARSGISPGWLALIITLGVITVMALTLGPMVLKFLRVFGILDV